jgi:hypothetical protein
MKVLLKNMQKEEHTVELSGPQATVGELALKAEAAYVVEGGAVTLVHLGNVLNDKAKTLAEVGVVDGGLVIAVLKKGKTVCQDLAFIPSCSLGADRIFRMFLRQPRR